MALTIASCLTNVADADKDDPLAIAGAVLVCVQGASETIAKLVTRIMIGTGKSSKAIVSTAGAIARASIYLALVGPVFNSMNWVAATLTDRGARIVSVVAAPIPKRVRTEVAVLDIYDSAGRLRSKYAVDDYGGDPLDCYQPSQASKGPAVFQCGTVADDLPACWKNLDNSPTVLCLRRPWETTLQRVPVMGSEVGEMSDAAVPLGVQLADGSRWWLRLGGAWGNYGKNTVAVYGPQGGDPTDTGVLLKRDGEALFTNSDGTWSVLRGPDVGANFDARDKAKRVDVAKVWFVTGRWQ